MKKLLAAGFILFALAIGGLAQQQQSIPANAHGAEMLKRMTLGQQLTWAANNRNHPFADTVIEGEKALGNTVFSDSPKNTAHYALCVDMRVNEKKWSPACERLQRTIDHQIALARAASDKEFHEVK